MEGHPRALRGREEETRAIAEAIRGDGAVLVIGEAGIGKTALVRAAAVASGRPLHEGGALATIRTVPYLSLRRATGLDLRGDPATVAADVERHVGPDILFVDDLQWADGASVAVITLLIGRIVVVGAVRGRDEVPGAMTEALERVGATWIELAGLSSDAAAAIARDAAAGGTSEPAIDDVVRRAGGNPLLLEELARDGAPSPTLERSIVGRLDRLDPATRDLVGLLAIAGRPLSRASLADAVDAVDTAIGAGLVVEIDGDVSVRHELVVEAVRGSLDHDERRRLHLRIAGLPVDAGDRARHLVAGGRPGAALTAALEALGSSTDPRERAALLAIAAEASRGERSAALELEAARTLDEVAEWTLVAKLQQDPSATPAQAAEHEAIQAHAWFALARNDRCRERLEAARAIDVDGSSHAAARLAIEVATYRVNVDGDIAGALEDIEAALAGRPASDPDRPDLEVLRASIRMLATGSGDLGLIRRGLDDAFEAGRFRTATDRARVIQYLLMMGVGTEATLAFLLEQQARFERARIGSMALDFLADAIWAAFLGGHLGRAVTMADQLLEQPAPPRASQAASIARGRALAWLGRFEEADAALRRLDGRVTSDFLGRGEQLTARAEAALWGGRTAEAVDHAEAAIALPAPLPLATVLPSLTRAWGRMELGLEPATRIDAPLSPSLAGAPVEIEALGAWHGDRPGEAAAAFDDAAARWDGFNAPRSLACRWAAGETRRLAGLRDDSIAGLQAALVDAERMGCEPLAARMRRSLRRNGIRVPTPRRRAATGSPLTARERELVGLVEQGLSNVEIARRLGLGHSTVVTILSSAMTKLGAARRTQLAATADRR